MRDFSMSVRNYAFNVDSNYYRYISYLINMKPKNFEIDGIIPKCNLY